MDERNFRVFAVFSPRKQMEKNAKKMTGANVGLETFFLREKKRRKYNPQEFEVKKRYLSTTDQFREKSKKCFYKKR